MQDMRRLEFLARPDIPMFGPAYEFDMLTYGIAAYSKPAISLLTLERVLGEETMLEIMSTFFERYVYAHPTTFDFQQVAQEVSGADLDWFFDGLVFGEAALNWVAVGLEDQSITVASEGSLYGVPTEVEVTFAGGETRRIAV
jgi:aminopeptidase N